MNDMAPPLGGDLAGTIVVILGSIATLYAFVVAVRTTLRPGESESEHPKLLIFRDDR
jgi:hypothetical protein